MVDSEVHEDLSDGRRIVRGRSCAASPTVRLGENGAGKSTLMKCLVGYHQPDAGQIVVGRRERSIRSPHDAHALGVMSRKADVFSGRQTRRGESQTPRSLGGRGEGNRAPEAHRRSHRRMVSESPGRNESERRGSPESA